MVGSLDLVVCLLKRPFALQKFAFHPEESYFDFNNQHRPTCRSYNICTFEPAGIKSLPNNDIRYICCGSVVQSETTEGLQIKVLAQD